MTGSYSNHGTLNATSIRIDHKLSGRWSVFGRYNYAPSNILSRIYSLSTLKNSVVNATTLTVGLNGILGDHISNSLRGNYSSADNDSTFSLDTYGGAQPLDPALLLTSLSPNVNFGVFAPSGVTRFEFGSSGENGTKQMNFVDDLSIVSGKHQLKFGGDYRALFLRKNYGQYFVQASPGTIQTFLSTSRASLFTEIQTPTQMLTNAFSFYGQDTWTVRPRLTVTYGLRWELNPFPNMRGNTKLVSWVNINNPALLSLAPPGTPAYQIVWHDIAPRIGIAYSLRPQGDLMLRIGGGTFYDLGLGDAADVGRYFPNFGSTETAGVQIPYNDVTPYLATLSTQAPYGTVYAIDPNINTPRSYQWNVALEKTFGNGQALSGTYVGQTGRALLRQSLLYQPNSQFTDVFGITKNQAFSNYDALELQYRRAFSSGLQALLSYTWSHSLDNASDDTVFGPDNTVISAESDYASSDYDVRHSFSGAVHYAIPPVHGNRVVSSIAEQWSLDSMVIARAGLPFNTWNQVTSAANGIAHVRPDIVPGQAIWISNANAATGKSLNPSAFVLPSTYRQGTEGRNDISGFHLIQVDLSVARTFSLHENVNLDFRADAFNVFNHPNFTNPSGYLLGGPSYLMSTQMLNHGLGGLNALFQEGGPRSLQLSLKLQF